MSNLIRTIYIVVPVLLFTLSALAGPEQETKVMNLVGSGTAKIKRKIGTEIIAAKGDKLLPGDALRTDANSTVDLGLADGSMLRVGPDSDYKVEEISKDKSGVWSWEFSLNSGSLRAVVEKTKRKDFVKFKTRTPTGTIGVRGTEFILRYLKDGQTKLFTTEGSVFIAPPGVAFTDKKRVRIVDRGFMSQIRKNDFAPSEPRKFDPSELLSDVRSSTTTVVAGASPAEQEVAKKKKPVVVPGKIDPLFYEVRGPKAMDSGTIPLDDEQMRKLIEEGQKKMEAAQEEIAKSAQNVAKGIQASEEAANASGAGNASLDSGGKNALGELGKEQKSLADLDVDGSFAKNGKDKLSGASGDKNKSSERCPEGFSKYDGNCVASPVSAGRGKSVCPENSEMGSNGQCIFNNNSAGSNEVRGRQMISVSQENNNDYQKRAGGNSKCAAVIMGSSVVCRGSGGASCSDSSCPGIDSIRQSLAKKGYTPNGGIFYGADAGKIQTAQQPDRYVKEGGAGLQVNSRGMIPSAESSMFRGVTPGSKYLSNPPVNPSYREEKPHCQAGDGNDCYQPPVYQDTSTFSGTSD